MTPVGAPTEPVTLVGVDWGTSSLRLVALNGRGETVATTQSGNGITRVRSGGFAQVLEQALEPWQLPNTVPLILSGMIGSRNGWVETPYLIAPAPLTSLASELVAKTSDTGRRLFFVPGVRLAGDRADVMRGEETELLGWFERDSVGSGDRSFVLPGTHCKWVAVKNRQITDFQTCMTGEVFATLCEHSILGRLMPAGRSDAASGPDNESFDRGAQLGLNEPDRLLANLFSARALPLLEQMPATGIRPYLAGLLIGSEVAGQLGRVDGPLVVIGQGELAGRYVRVLRLAGVCADCAAPGSAIAGQYAIAQMAGLINQ